MITIREEGQQPLQRPLWPRVRPKMFKAWAAHGVWSLVQLGRWFGATVTLAPDGPYGFSFYQSLLYAQGSRTLVNLIAFNTEAERPVCLIRVPNFSRKSQITGVFELQ